MTNSFELPVIGNPLGRNYYPGNVKLVRPNEDAQAFVAVIDVFRHPSMQTRAAAKEMLDRSLDVVDPAIFGNEDNLSHSLRTSTKLSKVRENEALMLSADVMDPEFSSKARSAKHNLWSAAHRAYSATIFDGARPLLHAGFRDAEYNDEWEWYWDEDRKPTDEETYDHPRLGYLVGDSETLIGKVGQDAIAAVFTVIESRQQYHKGALTAHYAGTARNEPLSENLVNMYTFGTVPYTEFTAALGSLATQPEHA
jgi:hypothetical protein